jgi:hypothetical protein
MKDPTSLGSDSAFPLQVNPETVVAPGGQVKGYDCFPFLNQGLTKRELFAAMAMQSLITLPNLQELGAGDIAGTALLYADALIKELERPQ